MCLIEPQALDLGLHCAIRTEIIKRKPKHGVDGVKKKRDEKTRKALLTDDVATCD